MGGMRIPGPSTFFAAAESLREGVTDMVFDLPGTVGEVLELLRRTTELVDRAEALLTDAEGLVARADATMTAAENMVRDGEAMLDRTAGVLADAEQSAQAAADLTERADQLLAPLEKLGDEALPVASRVIASIDPDEVEAVIGMVNHLPALLGHLEEDIMPMLEKLDHVGPDVHDILSGVQGITTAMSGIPGVSMLMRRGRRAKDHGGGIADDEQQRRRELPSAVVKGERTDT